MMKTNHIVIVVLGLVLSSIILAWGISRIRSNSNYVTVKGLSERNVVADQAWWSINTQVAANSTEEMQTNLIQVEKKIRAFLEHNGFDASEMNAPSINVYQNTYQGATSRLTSDVKLSVNTKDINKVIDAQKETGSLIAQGIFVQTDPWSAGPKYYFTKFKELKKEMLAEATQEAKSAAQEFANNSGSAVGKIRRANQGIFQILPSNQSQEDHTFFPQKIIRVVSTVDYFLE